LSLSWFEAGDRLALRLQVQRRRHKMLAAFTAARAGTPSIIRGGSHVA